LRKERSTIERENKEANATYDLKIAALTRKQQIDDIKNLGDANAAAAAAAHAAEFGRK